MISRKPYIILFTLSLIAALPAFGMEDTYPCDNCQQKKTELNYTEQKRDGITCLHILCQECQSTIDASWRKPSEDKVWWPCNYCSYFYTLYKKQCWEITQDTESILTLSASGQHATRFKMEYPDRTLPSITNETLFHPNPDNTIQWYHVASIPIAVIACYVAYKTFNNL